MRAFFFHIKQHNGVTYIRRRASGRIISFGLVFARWPLFFLVCFSDIYIYIVY